MGRARNLANLKPNADGLIEADDIAPGAVQTSVSALEATIPLASGASVTQQKTVFMDWAGQSGKQPTLASETTYINDTSGQSADNFFGNKTRIGNNNIAYEVTQSGQTITVTTFSKSGDYGWSSIGSISVTAPSISGSGFSGTSYGGSLYHAGGNKFILILSASNYDSNYTFYYGYDICPVDINLTTGSISAGSKQQLFPKTVSTYAQAAPLESGINGMLWWGSNYYIYTLGNSGSTPTISWGGSYPAALSNNLPSQVFKTTSNTFVALHSSGVHRFSLSGSTVSNYTNESLPTGITSNVGITRRLSDTSAFVQFGRNIGTIGFNPSTGAITVTGVASLSSIGRDPNYIEFSPDNRKGLIVLYNYNSNFYDTVYAIPFSISSNNTLDGYGIAVMISSTTARNNNYGWYSEGVIWQGNNTFDIKVRNYYTTSAPTTSKMIRVTVPENAYSSATLNLVGIAKSSTASGSATVYTSGIIGGFSNLIPGVNYFADISTTNGDITTSSNGYLLGFAISPTQIRR